MENQKKLNKQNTEIFFLQNRVKSFKEIYGSKYSDLPDCSLAGAE